MDKISTKAFALRNRFESFGIKDLMRLRTLNKLIFDIALIPFGGHGDLFSAQASPPKTLGVIKGLLNNH